MNINRRGFLLGSAAATTLVGCATSKMGLRQLKPGEKRRVGMIGRHDVVRVVDDGRDARVERFEGTCQVGDAQILRLEVR